MNDLQKLIINNRNQFSQKDFDEAFADAELLGEQEFTEKWDKLFKEKVRGWANTRKAKPKDLATRLREDFADDDFAPAENYKEDVYESKYKDVGRDEFEQALSNMRKYSAEYKAEGEANKARRARIEEMEGKKAPFYKNLARNLLTSEYSKQRYIEDPTEVVPFPGLYEQTNFKKWNPYSKEGQADIADNIIHLTSTVPDIIAAQGKPLKMALSTLAGPAERALRNRIVDSDIEEENPFSKFLGEVSTNVGVSFAPTAWVAALQKRGKNIVKGGGLWDDVSLKMAIADEDKAIKEGLKSIDLTKDYSKIMKDVNRLPNSAFKTEMQKAVKDPNFKKETLEEIVKTYGSLSERSGKELAEAYDIVRKSGKYEMTPKPNVPGAKDYMTRKMLDPELSIWGKAVYGATRGAPIAEGIAKAYAQSEYEGKPEIYQTEEEKQKIIDILKPKWKAGFAPKKGDKYYELYREYMDTEEE